MIKCLIVDDEPHSRENLRQMLNYCCPEAIVIDEAASVKSGIEKIQRYSPNLVFLDIRMPDGTGFDLLEQIGEIRFKVIFVTAYEEFAIKAFKFNAIDYITKPIDPGELHEAVLRANNHLDIETSTESVRELIDSIRKPLQPHKKIVLKTLNTVHIIEIDKIVRLESERNYTYFHLDGEEKLIISRSMKEYVDLLSEYGFIRVHNSHLININYVRKFHKDDLLCVLSDNKTIPVAYRKREELMNAIKKL